MFFVFFYAHLVIGFVVVDAANVLIDSQRISLPRTYNVKEVR